MIVSFDIETTGLNVENDHIIQFSAIKFDDQYNIVETYDKYIQPYGNYVMSIPALAKHHITPNFLKDKPYFKDLANEIYNFIKGCDLLGYNVISFDAKLLKTEFKRVGINWDFSDHNIYDAFLEEKRRNGNNLGQTFKRYTSKTMEEFGLDPHNSLSDVKATIEIFKKQQEEKPYTYEEIISDDGLIKISEFKPNEFTYCFGYGKYSNVSLDYVIKYDKNYINWILNQNFSEKTKNFIKSYLNKKI